MKTRRQISFSISESIYEKLVDAKEKTGLSLSTIVNLTLKGYEIVDTRGSIGHEKTPASNF